MKKYINMAMLLGVCLTITACAAKSFTPSITETITETAGKIQTDNPVTAYESLDALNAVSGTKLVSPGVMGITDEHFNLIDCGDYAIAEYTYNLNGMLYILRGAPVTEDISGIYIKGKPAFNNNDSGQEFIYEDNMKLARWYSIEGQYVFTAEDGGKLDNNTFSAMVSEIKTLTSRFNNGNTDETSAESETDAFVYDLSSLTGHYTDRTSQRAYMDVYVTDDDTLDITVHWGNSASETSEWHMTAQLTSDGHLEYNNCSNCLIRTGESGDSAKEMIYEAGSGYFTIENNVLHWNGAADENCKDCIFEQAVNQ